MDILMLKKIILPYQLKSVLAITITLIIAISCSSAPKKSDVINTRKNRAAEYTSFAMQYFNSGEYSQALVFFNIALNENIAADFEEGISRTSNSIGKIYIIQGNIENAEKYVNEGYLIAKKLNNKDLIAVSAINFAEINLLKNNLDEAEKNIIEAQTNVNTNKYSVIAAESYHTIASIEYKKGNYQKSLEALNNAIAINREKKEHSRLASNYYFAASLYSRQNNFEKAIDMLNLALQEDRIEENSFGIAKDYKALGIVCIKNKNQEEAAGYFLKAFKIFNVLKNKQEQIDILNYLTEISANASKNEDVLYYNTLLKELKK
jgi:tetratricopeptide (TPR) repeat protein